VTLAPVVPGGATLSVRGRWGKLEAEPARPGHWLLELPAGQPFEAWCSAPGHVPRAVTGLTPPEGEERTLAIALEAFASVDLLGPAMRRIGPGCGAEPVEEEPTRWRLADLAPGRTLLRIQSVDRFWWEVELELAAGERRELELR
jgi:hypothetical protein